jgi:Helix-turn-helix domain
MKGQMEIPRSNGPRMMSVEEAAEYLRMSVAKVKTLCQQRAQERMGEYALPHFRVGRAVYFTHSALVWWIQKMKSQAKRQ